MVEAFAVLLIYLLSCLSQETAKWPCDLQVNLSPVTTSLTTQR